MTERSTEPAAWFVEQVGLAAEADEFPRIAGRMFGLLLLSEAPRSLDEIAAALGASKASVSTDARLLLRHGVLERVGKLGDRRDYYQVAPDFFARLVRYRLSRWTLMHDLIGEARRRIPDPPAAVRARLAHADAIHEHLLARVERALAEWEAGQAGKTGQPRRAGRTGRARAAKAGRAAR